MEFTRHEINHFKERSTAALSVFALLRRRHPSLVPKCVLRLKRNPGPVSSAPHLPPSPQATTNLLSVSMGLPVMDMSRTRNQSHTSFLFVNDFFHSV